MPIKLATARIFTITIALPKATVHIFSNEAFYDDDNDCIFTYDGLDEDYIHSLGGFDQKDTMFKVR